MSFAPEERNEGLVDPGECFAPPELHSIDGQISINIESLRDRLMSEVTLPPHAQKILKRRLSLPPCSAGLRNRSINLPPFASITRCEGRLSASATSSIYGSLWARVSGRNNSSAQVAYPIFRFQGTTA